MDKILCIIQELNEIDDNWKKYLKDNDLYDQTVVNETKDCINKLLGEMSDAVKAYIDADDETGEEAYHTKLKEALGEEEYEIIYGVIKSSLRIYRQTKMIRKNPDIAADLIRDVYERLSVRYDPDIFDAFEHYGVNDQQTYITAIVAIDKTVSSYMGRHYSKEIAKREFENATGLTGVCSMVYAELYESNYEILQKNLLIDRLNDLANVFFNQ